MFTFNCFIMLFDHFRAHMPLWESTELLMELCNRGLFLELILVCAIVCDVAIL